VDAAWFRARAIWFDEGAGAECVVPCSAARTLVCLGNCVQVRWDERGIIDAQGYSYPPSHPGREAIGYKSFNLL